ncbi:protein 108-like [Rosa rugosa]|uniref:protein 108-like n=1 Tax=Rosa rugosa TaxID=74645 RepID=UPI002B415E4E|nr:protein 108-like [Rosa rugosa]
MAGFKSMIISSQAAALLLVALMGLALVHIQMAEAQGSSCAAVLTNLNVCAPFVVPGSNDKPSSDCCNAVQAVETSCICNTLRMAAQLPSQCNLPPLSCGTN